MSETNLRLNGKSILNVEIKISSTFSNLRFFSPESNSNLNRIINDKGDHIDNILKVIKTISVGKGHPDLKKFNRKRGKILNDQTRKLSELDGEITVKDLVTESKKLLPRIKNKNDNQNVSRNHKVETDISYSKCNIFLTNLNQSNFDIQEYQRKKKISFPNLKILSLNKSRNNNSNITPFNKQTQITLTENSNLSKSKVKQNFYYKLNIQNEFASNFEKVIKSEFKKNLHPNEKKILDDLNKDKDLINDEKNEKNHFETEILPEFGKKKFDNISKLNDNLVFRYRDLLMDRYKISQLPDDMNFLGVNKNKEKSEKKMKNNHGKIERIIKTCSDTKILLLKKINKIQNGEDKSL